uniref:Malectin-like domain-containing protein n=1 Tax=Oryza meridionalis TaxID=40149 RepID=A0A0E0EMW5_9ORYZ
MDTASADSIVNEDVELPQRVARQALQLREVEHHKGTPFISGLDLRPLKAELYLEATANQSLLLLNHDRPPARFAFNWRPASYYKLFSALLLQVGLERKKETKITSIRMGMRELLGVYHKAPPLFHPVVITPFVYLEVVCQRVDY